MGKSVVEARRCVVAPRSGIARNVRLPALLVAFATLGCGGGGSPHVPSGLDYVLAPEQPHYGASFAVWSQRWWQWCYELPRTNHPLFESTGEHVALGQVDPVWFIGGEIGSLFTPSDGVAERTVSIPSGSRFGTLGSTVSVTYHITVLP